MISENSNIKWLRKSRGVEIFQFGDALTKTSGTDECNVKMFGNLPTRQSMSWLAILQISYKRLQRSFYEDGLSIFCALPSHTRTALANISLACTLLLSLAQSKKAPLNFRCRLYVSSGGGANLSFSMSPMFARTRSVIVWFSKS